MEGENAKLWEFFKKAHLKRRRQYPADQLQRSQIDAQLKALKIQMATESNAIRQAIASMNQYQQMGNTGAIAILQIKETGQAFKAAVARLERAKAGLNPAMLMWRSPRN